MLVFVVTQRPFKSFAQEETGQIKFKAVSTGGSYVVAVNEDGTVVAWGSNAAGQCL